MALMAYATDPLARCLAIDQAVSHIWMVRTVLKETAEMQSDDDLRGIVEELDRFAHAVGMIDSAAQPTAVLKMARKRFKQVRRAAELFEAVQPEISQRRTFVMAARSLRVAIDQIAANLS